MDGRRKDDIVDDDKNFVDDNKVIVATVPTKRKTYNLKNRNRNYVKYNVNDNADNDKDFTNVTNKIKSQNFEKKNREYHQKEISAVLWSTEYCFTESYT